MGSSARRRSFGYNKQALVLTGFNNKVSLVGLDLTSGRPLWSTILLSDIKTPLHYSAVGKTKLLEVKKTIGSHSAVINVLISYENAVFSYYVEANNGHVLSSDDVKTHHMARKGFYLIAFLIVICRVYLHLLF